MYHVIRPEGAAHLNRPHVIVHRMKLYDDEIVLLDGIPLTTPERTWLRCIPTARSKPSSRLRSTTDNASVLAMPNNAITTARNSNA